MKTDQPETTSVRRRGTPTPWGLLMGFAIITLQGCGDDGTSPELDQPSPSVELSLSVAPHADNALMAVASVVSSATGEVAIVLSSGETEERSTRSVSVVANQAVEIVVVGMRALTQYSLKGVLDLGNGLEAESAPVLHTTGALPGNAPSVGLRRPTTGTSEGGITLFSYGSGRRADSTEPLYFGVDEEGEVVWYLHDTDIRSGDGVARGLANGNLLVFLTNSLAEITPAGEIVSTYVPGGESFHHDALVLPNGNLLFLTAEVGVINNDASPHDGERISYDVISAVDPQSGATVWSWSTADHFDTARFPSALSERNASQGGLDWTHANALHYSPTDNTVLLSSRSQSWVVKIDPSTDEIVWVFGGGADGVDPNFAPPFFALENGTFQTAQHAPTITANGDLLVFDNRNDSNGDVLNSRAVRYSLDEQSFIARQVWEFVAPKYAPRLGDVDELANGNVLVTAGGGDDQTAYVSEVEPDGSLVWEIVIDAEVYRAERIAWEDFR